MGSLYEYITKNSEANQPALLPSSNETKSAAVAVTVAIESAVVELLTTHDVTSKKDALQISDGMAKLVTEDDFLKQLSDTIQKPTKGESEDDFVKRCNSALRSMLDEHLDKSAKE